VRLVTTGVIKAVGVSYYLPYHVYCHVHPWSGVDIPFSPWYWAEHSPSRSVV